MIKYRSSNIRKAVLHRRTLAIDIILDRIPVFFGRQSIGIVVLVFDQIIPCSNTLDSSAIQKPDEITLPQEVINEQHPSVTNHS